MGGVISGKHAKSTSKEGRARIERSMQAHSAALSRLESLFQWDASCARFVGSSHLLSGSPCQDNVCADARESHITIACLADGAGSARFSHYGSEFVVRKAVELTKKHINEALGSKYCTELFKDRLIAQLQLELADYAKMGIDFTENDRLRYTLPAKEEQLFVPCPIKDLSCTLLLVAIKGARYIAIHLGDGVIGAEVQSGNSIEMRTLSMPDNGEFANETYFITSKDAAAHAHALLGFVIEKSKDITGFILMSDGPEAALLDKRRSTLAPACHKLIDANRHLAREDVEAQLTATLEKVICKKTSDDCSLAIISRPTG